MLPLTQNEIAALQLLLPFMSLQDILISAQKGFDEYETVKDSEKADLCWKAVQAFLK